MILYHGSDSVVTNPLTDVGRKGLDFGPGFYLTNFFDQAVGWSCKVCVLRDSDSPVISEYILDEKALPEGARWLRMEQYDLGWLTFVISSRRGEQPWKDYDIIEGCVANDEIIDIGNDYFSGRITAEQAIGELQHAKHTHQLCLLNQSIIDACLKFVKSHPPNSEEGSK